MKPTYIWFAICVIIILTCLFHKPTVNEGFITVDELVPVKYYYKKKGNLKNLIKDYKQKGIYMIRNIMRKVGLLSY